jgi:osmoprotectant transport system ATP-binding protein
MSDPQAAPGPPTGDAAAIVFDRATRRYEGSSRPALDGLSLTIPAGDICVLVGPSGGGKTTALRMVNRLVDITEGDIRIDGRSVRTFEPAELRRGIGYVIQQVGLFPHLTVAANVATVPRLLRWDRHRTAERTTQLLELVGLEPAGYENRYPSELSGGERQRVGLARAMAADPPLMLMDEPFGALDPITRARLQDEFLRLHHTLRKTVIFVTHDIDEAIKMGNRIAVLREHGVLAQYGTPQEILAQPADDYVARFVGADRALKRLALITLGELHLEPPPDPSAPDGATARTTTSLRDALSVMLTQGGRPLVVVDGDGRPVGRVSLDDVTAVLGSGPESHG